MHDYGRAAKLALSFILFAVTALGQQSSQFPRRNKVTTLRTISISNLAKRYRNCACTTQLLEVPYATRAAGL